MYSVCPLFWLVLWRRKPYWSLIECVFSFILPSNLCIYACTGEDEYDEGDVVVDERVDDLRIQGVR